MHLWELHATTKSHTSDIPVARETNGTGMTRQQRAVTGRVLDSLCVGKDGQNETK